MTRFLVLAMPRSRTYWTSRFLSYDREVAHDPFLGFNTREDVKEFFFPTWAAAVDTVLGYAWRGLPALLPNVNLILLRRPLSEVIDSFRRLGVASDGLTAILTRYDQIMDGLAASGLARNYTFRELEDEDACRDLFEFCLRRKFDRDWWMSMKDRNLQCDVRASLTKVAQRGPAIDRMLESIYAS